MSSARVLDEHWLVPAEPFASYDAYLGAVRGEAIAKARRLPAEVVLDDVLRSGLRGRGGAGFPTGVKWRTVARHDCPTRHAVMNAAEGEPGTFKDRWLLRANPYAPLEGLAIAAHVVGAREAFVAIKASFRAEVARLRQAIAEMKDALAPLSIRIVEGPDEYLFGEEKALLEVIEGNAPFPREADDPPYEHGLFATPTSSNPAVVNNVETYAHVPSIVRSGAKSFRAIGTADTPGTLLFTLSGDVARPGVYEAPAGIPLDTVFRELGGGPREGRAWRAALSGVAAGVLPAERFGVAADFGSLSLAGSGLGSAGFVLVDDRTSLARVAQTVIRFLWVESCNQCYACKTGLGTAARDLDALFGDEPGPDDLLERAVLAARSAPQGNRCYLPVQGSLLLASLVGRFRGELEALVKNPSDASAPWPLPQIEDFDPETRTFRYDGRQARKLPNWSYEEPEPPAAVRPLAPARRKGSLSVRLAADVTDAMEDLAKTAGTDVEQETNEALRDWLRRRR